MLKISQNDAKIAYRKNVFAVFAVRAVKSLTATKTDYRKKSPLGSFCGSGWERRAKCGSNRRN